MDQVTVVTGAGRGIGAAVARRPAAAGHHVAVGCLRDAEAAEQVAGAVAWLLSPAASYTTGAVLRVAGGL
jgi:NAD(P)-dependent dehydrogenase (short-subunit alcohol dehydrogenase family)